MLKILRFISVMTFATTMCGCSTVGELTEPKHVPSLVESYRIKGLDSRVAEVGTMLCLDECAEYAVLSSIGLSGVPSVAGHFPVRHLVLREFQKVIAGNFRTVLPDEEPKMELRVNSNRLVVRRSWSRVSAEMDFEVQLLDTQRGRLYLRKQYHLTAESVQRDKRDVPACVYSCVQNLALRFIEDVSGDTHVIARLKALSEEPD